ncbi:hypothetical protein B0H67DRAFT_326711 [Lasiosphaeris hirsuta]|uniref:Uncharacterized protein n=1 Tax=Lasiosphaeris hirsuta TaxID=260670 RepID=A0AA40DLY2_9PEZI|nr:hypothetical protein B0H67DRAFT_326711 [Lasiosphaeris hirsuta]
MSRVPGLVFVQSKIKSTDMLSPEVFKKWYEEAHIPDLLASPASGVGAAARYIAADVHDESAARGFPYLAVYPEVDLNWIASDECTFLKVPLHHSILPAPSHAIFDVADFQMGAYEPLAKVEIAAFEGSAKHLVVVTLDAAVAEGRDQQQVLQEAVDALGEAVPLRSTLIKYGFAPTRRPPRDWGVDGERFFIGRKFLAFHQFNELPVHIPSQGETPPIVLNLLRAFGNLEARI